MKIRRVWAELSRVDRRSDRHDVANGRFSQFCEKRLKKIREMLLMAPASKYTPENKSTVPRTSGMVRAL